MSPERDCEKTQRFVKKIFFYSSREIVSIERENCVCQDARAQTEMLRRQEANLGRRIGERQVGHENETRRAPKVSTSPPLTATATATMALARSLSSTFSVTARRILSLGISRRKSFSRLRRTRRFLSSHAQRETRPDSFCPRDSISLKSRIYVLIPLSLSRVYQIKTVKYSCQSR